MVLFAAASHASLNHVLHILPNLLSPAESVRNTSGLPDISVPQLAIPLTVDTERERKRKRERMNLHFVLWKYLCILC
jgi:hypothetical protein